MALWLQLVKEKKFKSITHNFLISGHTHLPSDRDFALIEKCHRKYAPQIYSPGEWHDIISKANRKTPFEGTNKIFILSSIRDILSFINNQ